MKDQPLPSVEPSAGPLRSDEHPLFARAFREHYPDLLAFIRRRVGTDAEAADIAQEAYLRVLRYRHEKNLTVLRMLVFRIAANLVGMRARFNRAAGRPEYIPLEDDLAVVAGQPGQERQIEGEQQLDRLMAVIEKFPRRRRQAFVLRRFQGLSLREISQRMNISTKAVERHITAAIARLQKTVRSDAP